jgi:hypothetical protein
MRKGYRVSSALKTFLTEVITSLDSAGGQRDGFVADMASRLAKVDKIYGLVKTTDRTKAQGEGVYLYFTQTQKYVGESKSVISRLGRHDYNLKKESSFIIREEIRLMPGSTKSQRREVEQAILQAMGGPKSQKTYFEVRNMIHAIGAAR